MTDLGLDALVALMDAATGRCAYADARHVVTEEELLVVRGGAVERAERDESAGVGVRVLVDGAWGFAATSDLSRSGLKAALGRALATAGALPSASAFAAERPRVAEPAARGAWSSACAVDPFTLALEDKLALLTRAEAALRVDPRLVRTEAVFVATRSAQAFASTEGAAVTQRRVSCGAGLSATAVGSGEVQTRTYPSAHGGLVRQSGWEHVLALDLVGTAPRIGTEAVALLTAPPCPSGPATLVLGAEQLALQVHESIGHALELDRMQLLEAAYAGTSWVGVDDVGTLRYGSDALSVTADATLAGGLGTFAWDDEGAAARRTTLIDGGRLVGTLSDRQSAGAAGLAASGACARADGFARQPVVRMTNVSIEPGGAGSLADLLADTGSGLYLETNRSWSIDDRRLHFQFATEVAYEIRGGELGRLFRNPSYHGVTPSFWASLDAVCGASEWSLWGVTNCGKAEPGQFAAVSHGAAPARFRGVEVGVA